MLHEPGWHTVACETKYCAAIPRVEFKDPRDEGDLELTNGVLHEFAIEAASADSVVAPEWDVDSALALRAEYERQFRTCEQYPADSMAKRGEANEETRHLAVAGAWGLFPRTRLRTSTTPGRPMPRRFT